METWINRALELGFDTAVPCKISTLVPMQEMRDMCTPEACHSYGTNWGCASAVGTLEECRERINRFDTAILIQTIGQLEDPFDGEGLMEAALLHKKRFLELSDEIREVHPGALCLGAGECDICRPCKYPEPCAFPERAVGSMSAYGLYVARICQTNKVKYNNGPNTITYTAVILYE